MKPTAKHAARIFVTAFLGSAITLMIGGQFFIESDIEGVTVPDWSLLDEFLISAVIAGVVALFNWLLLVLESENGGTK
jgi:H+/Cl- antiporter ClcA